MHGIGAALDDVVGVVLGAGGAGVVGEDADACADGKVGEGGGAAGTQPHHPVLLARLGDDEIGHRAFEDLRSRGVDDLSQVTLLSDGTSVYECTSPEEVVDLLRGGQGVFGIAVSGALRELRGSLAHLPGERADGVETQPLSTDPQDELARRRQQRSATA